MNLILKFLPSLKLQAELITALLNLLVFYTSGKKNVSVVTVFIHL